MRKKLMCHLALFFIGLISTFALSAQADHLQNLKSKFPHGLLGDDYGILTEDDLALNACYIRPQPFVAGKFTPYQYWQCFKSKAISPQCGNIGILDGEGVFGHVSIKVYADQTTHRFIASRPWPVQDCRSFVKDLKNLMRGTSHACISASFIEYDLDKSGQKTAIGIFHRMKTRKGYEGEEGRLTVKMRNDFCPNLRVN